MKKIFALVFITLSLNLKAQQQVPTDYFSNPLEVDLILSGTFGELRSNHFHSGLDIKTQQREGLNVIAAAEGYVSRINVQHFGYGKVIYVTHPNGYTTVYGHVQKFAPEIEAYVKKYQYEKESYEVELHPQPGELPVSKGELIALSGNTGGSGGPHLHFEIRDHKERAMNPKMFGIDIKDSQAPTVTSLYAYAIGEDSHINGSAQRQRIPLIPMKDGSFKTAQVEACGNIGFGISAYDKQDAAANNNGVFKIQGILNGDKVFELNMESFTFDETRHLNQLIDYEYFSNNRSRISQLFTGPNNPMSIYRDLVNRGILNIQNGLDYIYTIKVSDFAGNEKLIRIPIKGENRDSIITQKVNETNYFVQANEPFTIEENPIDIFIPKNSLYYDTFLDVSFKGDTVYFHKDDTAIHNYVTIAFDVSKYSPEEKEKMFIARLGNGGRPSYSSTTKKENRFTTGVRNFGTYTLASDVKPPSIAPVNFKNGQWISSNSDIKVRISDDLSGIKSYRATINGKFILMEYEYKNNTLTYNFSDNIITDSTENNFKIIVTDNVGNSNSYEATFFRK